MSRRRIVSVMAILLFGLIGCLNGNSESVTSGGISSSSSSVGVNGNLSSSSDIKLGISVAVQNLSSSSSVTAVSHGVFTDTRDGQIYKTVKIGVQNWMAQNLNFAPVIRNSWCYANSAVNCVTYGRLYDWASAMNLDTSCNSKKCAAEVKPVHQGLCPVGWHVPSDLDWKILEMAVGMTAKSVDSAGVYRGAVGIKLKSLLNWSNGNGSDFFGFTALPAGYSYSTKGNTSFYGMGLDGRFWSTDEVSAMGVWYRSLSENHEGVYRGHYAYSVLAKNTGISLRCLQDN